MAAYLLVEIEIIDREVFEEYRKLVTPMIESFGGRYLVRGGAVVTVVCLASFIFLARRRDSSAARRAA